MTTTNGYDKLNRLTNLVSTAGAATAAGFTYQYNAANQRTASTTADNSYWVYQYDALGQVISGKKFWSDGTPVAGQQFEYVYDTIGNRTSTKAGGDSSGANLRSESYTANALNQYSSKTVAGAEDVIGAAYATSTVTVNGSSTYRKGEYYRNELTITNGSGPVYQSVTNTATQGTNSTTITGNLLVPPATQTFAYDADGNLTNDSVWAYQYDAENRLIQMTNLTTVVSAARKKLTFTYDYMGRRTTKQVFGWDSLLQMWNLLPTTFVRFVYDGWNLVAEVDANNNLLRSYLWGQDLSGTMDKAGGIGGLLLMRDHVAGTYHFAAYDGNGNVMALINAADNSISAQYEYSPFGETIRATGPLAKGNPFRWSTKFWDEETGLVYYGYRYLSPVLGRWLGRDPIGEEGGINLLGFVLNNPTTGIDTLGDAAIWVTDDLRIDADGRGTHVHDYGENVSYAYGVDANDDPILTPLRGHEKEFDLGRAQKSMRGVLQSREGFQALKSANASLWRRAGTTAGRVTRATLRATGKAIKAAGRAAGVAGAVFAIMSAAEGSQQMANAVDDYARHAAAGETAWAELDAIEVAVGVQNMTGNYFITMDVLSIMLP